MVNKLLYLINLEVLKSNNKLYFCFLISFYYSPMKLKQIEYYNSLSDSEQYVLGVAALIGDNISVYYFPANSLRRRKISNKLVSVFLENAYQQGLFVKSFKNDDYTVSPEFLIYILPQMKGYSEDWEYVNDRYRYFYYGTSYIRNLRDFLYV